MGGVSGGIGKVPGEDQQQGGYRERFFTDHMIEKKHSIIWLSYFSLDLCTIQANDGGLNVDFALHEVGPFSETVVCPLKPLKPYASRDVGMNACSRSRTG